MVNDGLLPLERFAMREYRGALDLAKRSICGRAGTRRERANYAQNTLMIAEQLMYRRLGTMAVNRVSGKDFVFDSWVNVRLSEDDKARLAELSDGLDCEDLLNFVAERVYNGYSFSCSWDDYSGAHQASFVCKAKGDPNYGFGMSARHPDFMIALLSLQYKHQVVCHGEWTSVGTSRLNGVWD